MRRKRSRPVLWGVVGKVPSIGQMHGNSLASYPTASSVLRGLGDSNAPRLPDVRHEVVQVAATPLRSGT